MRLFLIIIVTWLTCTALSQNPCQHAFILYNAASGTEVSRFTDATYPPQFSIDQSKLLDGIATLSLVASLCNNVPPFQSAAITVSNLTGISTSSGPIIDISIVESGQPVAISGNFLKVPGVYTISASSYSQVLRQGLVLDTLEVAVYVYRTCQRGFILYNTSNQTEIARFPDVGIHQYFLGPGPVIASTQGSIDLLQLGDNVGLNLVAEFCNPLVTNVSFYQNFQATPFSVSKSRPFSIGSKRRNKLVSTPFLKLPTFYNKAIQHSFLSARAQGGVDELDMYLNVVPSYRVVSFTLVNANTGADLVTSVVSEDYVFVQASTIEVDLGAYPADASFSIRANTVGAVQSVGFFVSNTALALKYIPSPHSTFVANVSPFAMAGITPTGYNPVANLSSPGFYYLDTLAFTGLNLTGNQGPAHMLYISVLASTNVVSSLTWVDTTTNSDISVYSYTYSSPTFLAKVNSLPQYELDPLRYPGGTTFSIRANPTGTVSSVEFNLLHIDDHQGASHSVYQFVANSAPYCLGGNDGNGHCLAVPVLETPVNISTNAGFSFQLDVTPFSGSNKQGVAGPTKAFSLNIRPNFYITKITLINANTGETLFDFSPTLWSLDLSQFRSNVKFAIRAHTAGNVGSIAFTLCPLSPSCTTTVFDHLENRAQLSKATDPFIYIPNLLKPNHYYLDAIPYSDVNKSGSAGPEAGVTITVLARWRVESFTLVNATSGDDITTLQVFENVEFPVLSPNNIDISKYPNNITSFSIRANTVGIVGSVGFRLYRYSDYTFTERVLVNNTADSSAPFALGGETASGGYQAVPQLSTAGYYGIVATPYSRTNKRGLKGPSLEVNITVAAFKGFPI